MEKITPIDQIEDGRGRELDLRDIILGGQDGMVNVLGVTAGVAAASGDTRLTIAAGLAATFAESFSMAAVAYTSAVFGRRAVLDALIVGVSAILGSFIPLLPFIFLPISTALWVAVSVSAVALFFLGIYKARVLKLGLLRVGLEVTIIGMIAALVGYLVGLLFKAPAV